MAVTIGVVGCGHGHIWLDAFNRVPETEIIALAALPDDPRRGDAAEKYGLTSAQVFDSHTALLAARVPDVLVVATPPTTHVRIGCDGLEAGAHCLIEKPPTVSSRGARDLFFRALFVERVLGWAFCFRHAQGLPPVRHRVQQAHVTWKRSTQNGADWALQHDVSGGGALVDLGIHGLDLALALMGYPEVRLCEAEAFDAQGRKTTSPVEHRLTGVVECATGQRLTIETSWASDEAVQRIAFAGPDSNQTLDVAADDDLFLRTAHGFLKTLYSFNVAQQLALAAQGVECMRVVEALYRSAHLGHGVKLS